MKSIFEIYESIILEAMSLKDIWEKYYERLTDYEAFLKINAIDPTSSPNKKGKYLDWLIRRASYKDNNTPNLHIWEDADAIRANLELFDKNYKHINKQITQVKDQYELAKLVSEFKEKKDSGELDTSKFKNEIDVVYNDSKWMIVIPKTEQASCYYGKDTEWCTAKYPVGDKRNAFNYYSKKGPLYTLINKENKNEKYQFHFHEEQYMNKEDIPISEEEFNNIPEKVLIFLINLAKKYDKTIEFINEMPDVLERDKYFRLFDKEYNQYTLNKILLNKFEYRRSDEHNPLAKLNIVEIKELIADGAQVNKIFKKVITSILRFYKLNDDVLEILLDNYTGDLNMVYVDGSILAQVIRKGNSFDKVIKKLLDKKVDISLNKYDAFKEAVKGKDPRLCKILIDKGTPITFEDNWALYHTIACTTEKGNKNFKEDLDFINFLLANGAKDGNLESPILESIKNRDIDVLKLLIKYGADVSEDQYLSMALNNFRSASVIEIVELLLINGANPENIKDNISVRQYNEIIEMRNEIRNEKKT